MNVTPEECLTCHSADIGTVSEKVNFPHEKHIASGLECGLCHPGVAENAIVISRARPRHCPSSDMSSAAPAMPATFPLSRRHPARWSRLREVPCGTLGTGRRGMPYNDWLRTVLDKGRTRMTNPLRKLPDAVISTFDRRHHPGRGRLRRALAAASGVETSRPPTRRSGAGGRVARRQVCGGQCLRRVP